MSPFTASTGEGTTTASSVGRRPNNNGKACTSCRRRKLRCDRVHPVCGSCIETRDRARMQMERGGASKEEIESVRFPSCFEDYSEHQVSKVNELSASTPSSSSTSTSVTESSTSTSTDESSYPSAWPTLPWVVPTDRHTSTAPLEVNYQATPSSSSLADVNIPLPDPARLHFLVDLFLDSPHSPCLFQPGRFRERLKKDFNDAEYPHASVLHIMLAIAYAQYPEVDSTRSLDENDRTGAHQRHTQAAFNHLYQAYHDGIKPAYFDLCRAQILLGWKQFGAGDVTESYFTKASAIRACIILGLHVGGHERAVEERGEEEEENTLTRSNNSWDLWKENDQIEEEERRLTMATAFAYDRWGMFATLWPGNLVEEDVTACLPRCTFQRFIQGQFDKGSTISSEPLFLQSSDLFSREPLDAKEVQYKGTILLGRCSQFISRNSRQNRRQFARHPVFQQLESYIATLSIMTKTTLDRMRGSVRGEDDFTNKSPNNAFYYFLTTPGNEKNVYREAVIESMLLPHACILTLHEPLAGQRESDSSCVGACRNAVSILKFCTLHAEEEMARCNGLLTHIIGMIGKSLIRQLESVCSQSIAQVVSQDVVLEAHHDYWGFEDPSAAVKVLRADLDVVLFILSLNGQRWAVAARQRVSLLKLLEFNRDHRIRNLFAVK